MLTMCQVSPIGEKGREDRLPALRLPPSSCHGTMVVEMAERREKEDQSRQERDRLIGLLEASQRMIEDQSQKHRKPNSLLSRAFGRPAVTGVLLAVFLISGTAWAGEYRIFGAGEKSCGSWIAAEENSWKQIVLHEWLNGYLTANSLWFESGSGPVSKTDPRGAWAWIDNYCQEKPLESVANAAVELIFAIQAQAN